MEFITFCMHCGGPTYRSHTPSLHFNFLLFGVLTLGEPVNIFKMVYVELIWRSTRAPAQSTFCTSPANVLKRVKLVNFQYRHSSVGELVVCMYVFFFGIICSGWVSVSCAAVFSQAHAACHLWTLRRVSAIAAIVFNFTAHFILIARISGRRMQTVFMPHMRIHAHIRSHLRQWNGSSFICILYFQSVLGPSWKV